MRPPAPPFSDTLGGNAPRFTRFSGKIHAVIFSFCGAACAQDLAFKADTTLSPLQFQKRVRLLHARSMLIAGQGNATSIAFVVGNKSPDPFSREYTRLLGLPPSKDLAKATHDLRAA